MRLAWLAAALVPSAALAQSPAGDGPPGTTAPAPAPPPASDTGANHAAPPPGGKDIVITVEGERSRNNRIAIWSVAGAGFLIGAVGLYYNLDARSSANAVTAQDMGHVAWTPTLQAEYDNAHSSSVKAGVFYGIGGAVIIGAIVGAIVTQPHSETTVIHPHGAGGTAAIPTVSPTAGGALVGGAWSF
jgi:hypothetical protein